MSYIDPGPQVIGIYPGKYATDIEQDVEIAVSFDKSIDATSVDSTAVALINLSSNASVALGTPSVSNRTITFSPAAALTSNTRYQVILKSTIASVDGITQDKDFTWVFTTTTSTTLSAPTLTSPASQSSLITTATPTAPTFTWSAVSGAHHYEIQVAVDPTFSVIYWPIGTYDPIETTVSPANSFATDTYYWRVRATSVAAPTLESQYSDWSETWSFYVGQEEVPHYQSQVLVDPESRKFYITAVSPEVGGTHIQASTWTITFNHAIDPAYVTSAYFVARRYDVDGLPTVGDTLSGTFTSAGATVTFTPAATEVETGTSYFDYNKEFTITINKTVRDTSGNKLSDEQIVWFTSCYSPLYFTWLPIKAELGDFIADLPVDIIHRFIHRASLEVLRMRLPLNTAYMDNTLTAPTLTQLSEVLAGDVGATAYYDVMDYVRARAEWMILQRKRMELLQYIDTRRILGSLSVDEASASLLAQIKVMMDELKALADSLAYLIGIWSMGYGRARSTQKAQRYLPYPYFWENIDYGAVLTQRSSPIRGASSYGGGPSANYISRSGYY